MPLLIITFVSLITCILLQQIIYVGHRQMMIGKIKLDYRKIKRVTYPKSSKLRFIYGQKSYETSLRFIDDFKLKKHYNRLDKNHFIILNIKKRINY